MQIHQIKKNKNNRKAKQVGRGGTRGKTAGRGTKGQNARSGRKKRPEMRDIIKRLPKLRGRGKNFLKSRFAPTRGLTLAVLDKNFSAGEAVTRASLMSKGLISNEPVKVLSSGAISKALNLSGIAVSDTARAAIEKAGGKVE
jgi:large subunit ribosomal protein L15